MKWECHSCFKKARLWFLLNSLISSRSCDTVCVLSLPGVMEWILGKKDAQWVGFIIRSVLENSTR